jgi:hypothetical protein
METKLDPVQQRRFIKYDPNLLRTFLRSAPARLSP